MLSDEKILVTGAAGQIAFPLVEFLAGDNEVWGVARFSKPELRTRLAQVGAERLEDRDVAALPVERVEEHRRPVHLRVDVDRGDRDELESLVVDLDELLGALV